MHGKLVTQEAGVTGIQVGEGGDGHILLLGPAVTDLAVGSKPHLSEVIQGTCAQGQPGALHCPVVELKPCS